MEILDVNMSANSADILTGADRLFSNDTSKGESLIYDSVQLALDLGRAKNHRGIPRNNLKSHELLDISYELFGKL